MKPNTKPAWNTPTRSSRPVIVLLLLFTAVCAAPAFAADSRREPVNAPPATATAADTATDTAAQTFTLFSDTYIPVSNTVKDALYGTSKAVVLGVTLPFFLTVSTAPYGNPDSAASKGVYDFFSRYCHRLPSRTLNAANGRPYPVCSRCQGMYIGYFLGNFDFLIWDAFDIPGWQRWEKSLLHIGTYTALFLPLIIDGTVQYYSFDYESNNAWRMTTGILFGYALTAIIDEMIRLTLDYPGVYRRNRISTDD